MSDTATPPLLATSDALAAVLRDHDWRAGDGNEYGLTCRHADHRFHWLCAVCEGDTERMADALLASGVMDRIRAEAWEAGAKAGHHSPLTWFALRQVNPYRAAALTEDPVVTLIEFLLTRIEEKQAEAEKIKAAIGADPGAFASIVHDHPELAAGDCPGWLADYDPARVLAECEAKRRIVEQHEWLLGFRDHDRGECRTCGWARGESCPTVLHLAAVYADHPDYREEWRP